MAPVSTLDCTAWGWAAYGTVVEVTNQEGELVAVADHLLQWVGNE